MKTLILSALTAISLMFTSAHTFAQGIPVYDAASFTQFLTQLEKMSQDYQKQIEQLNEASKQTTAITGARNMGQLLNGPFEEQLREYLPDNWDQTMNMLDGSNLPSGAAPTRNIYSQLYNEYTPLEGSEFITLDPSGPVAKSLDRRTSTTYAAMAASEQAFNSIRSRIQAYEGMLNELNNTTDLKASVDLQARIAAENGLILSELMRLNTIQAQLKATADNEQLVNYRRSTSANKYDAQQARQAMELQP